MRPWKTLDRARAPDGGELVLQERAGELAIRVDGHTLMSSRLHGSEEALAQVACAPLGAAPAPRVLIGGLGMGYTLRAALDRLPPGARVAVAELVPAVIAWNRGPLASLAGAPLEDPRVAVEAADVRQVLGRAPGTSAVAPPFDAVLLDVDNGPAALTRPGNRGLYDGAGLTRVMRALAPRGVLAVWSASPDLPFAQRLRDAGFTVSVRQVAARGGRSGTRHTLFFACT